MQLELKQLINDDRPNIIKSIAEARSHGDLSENAEYHSAKEKQSFIEGKIAELESTIAQAEIIDVSSLSGKEVKFGATVHLVDEDSKQQSKYQLVGESESDIENNKLSITSPLARALIGKTKKVPCIQITSNYFTREPTRQIFIDGKNISVQADLVKKNIIYYDGNKKRIYNFKNLNRNIEYKKQHLAILKNKDTNKLCTYKEGKQLLYLINQIRSQSKK